MNLNKKHADVFLSHCSKNKNFVRRLSADIEVVSHEGDALTTWLDEADIAHGQSITGLVNKGLEESRFFAIVMTPDYFNSKGGWTDSEWKAVLFSDPDNARNRIIPILAESCPYIPPLLKHLRYIDLRGKNYDAGLEELVAILMDKPLSRPKRLRGQMVKPDGRIDTPTLMAERSALQGEPDSVNERLLSNLYPVVSIPNRIYFGHIREEFCERRKDGRISVPSKSKFKELIREYQNHVGSENTYMPVFRLYEDQVVTCHNLDDRSSWLSHFVESGSVTYERTKDLLMQEDSYRIVVSLFNMALNRHMYRRGLVVDHSKHARFFFPTDNGGVNTIKYQSFRNKGSRDVAKPILKNDKVVSWLHQGAFVKFINLGERLFLQINPTWVLTRNGEKPIGGKDVAKTINRWQNAERNAAVLRHNKFWTSTISAGKSKSKIMVGDQFLIVDAKPVVAEMPVGIQNDITRSFNDGGETTVNDIIDGKLNYTNSEEYYGDYNEEYLSDDDLDDVEFIFTENINDDEE